MDGRPPRRLEVGRIVKPHNLRGEVIVDLISEHPDRRAPGAVFQTDRGELVLVSSRAHQGRWIMRFEGIDDRTVAETWRGVSLEADEIEDEDTLWVHDLVGAEVVTASGENVGRVAAVVANPASDLLELEDGRLIPLVFHLSTDRSTQGAVRLTIDPPDGLLDL